MAVGSARLNRRLVTATLILAFCLLSVLPHTHPVAVSDVPCSSRAQVHAPHPDPWLETGATPDAHERCATCCFQRLLSGGEVATCICSAPLFLPARLSAPPRAIARSIRAGLADPRGPPAA